MWSKPRFWPWSMGFRGFDSDCGWDGGVWEEFERNSSGGSLLSCRAELVSVCEKWRYKGVLSDSPADEEELVSSGNGGGGWRMPCWDGWSNFRRFSTCVVNQFKENEGEKQGREGKWNWNWGLPALERKRNWSEEIQMAVATVAAFFHPWSCRQWLRWLKRQSCRRKFGVKFWGNLHGWHKIWVQNGKYPVFFFFWKKMLNVYLLMSCLFEITKINPCMQKYHFSLAIFFLTHISLCSLSFWVVFHQSWLCQRR